MAEWTKATVLKTVVLRTPVNECLGPMKEAPSTEGASVIGPSRPMAGVQGITVFKCVATPSVKWCHVWILRLKPAPT